MNNSVFRRLLLPGVIVLAGCSGSTDPETAHLFDNVKNLNNGEYDRQIASKDAEAAAIVRQNNAASARISTLRSQSASNSAEIKALTSQISSLRAQTSSLRGKFSNQPDKLAQLNQLDGQLVQIRADVGAGTSPSVARAELNRVSAAIRALSR